MGSSVKLPISWKGSLLAARMDAASLCDTFVRAIVRIRQLSSNEDLHADAKVAFLEMALPPFYLFTF